MAYETPLLISPDPGVLIDRITRIGVLIDQIKPRPMKSTRKKKLMKFKETQVCEPQGRDMHRPVLERVIEAETAPEGAVPVPKDTPLSDWTPAGFKENESGS